MEPLEKDKIYHIYNRGINGESIFLNDENKKYFLRLMDKYISGKSRLYAYCLMDNHFHFLISPTVEGKEITQCLSNFFNAYAKAINKSAGRTGSLFEKHFKRICLDDEEYLKQAVLYIHLNPKHHFGIDFTAYRYSSYNSILSEKETKLERDEVLKLFEDRENFIFTHCQKNEVLNEKFKLE